MLVKASIVVMSHLSDIQEELSNSHYQTVNNRANFIKYIILQCDGDLNIEINPEFAWDKFIESTTLKLVDLGAKDIPSFLTTKMKLVVTDFLMDNKKLSAIKYICDEAKLQGRRIYLKDAKEYVDNL